MKIKDLFWILGIVLFTMIVIIPSSREIFNQLTENYPYLMGFIKTAYLATMGEMLVTRIKTKQYLSQGIHLKMIVWGIFGIIFVFIFKIFSSGVSASIDANLFPSLNDVFLNRLWTAFLTSLTMNLFFAPTFMLLHRITDQYIDRSMGQVRNIKKVKFGDVAKSIDMNNFLGFVVLRTIPLFWIPAHTITFLLPENYRILMAAYLSIALGIILTIAKNMKNTPQE
jgi:hypothetical protein